MSFAGGVPRGGERPVAIEKKAEKFATRIQSNRRKKVCPLKERKFLPREGPLLGLGEGLFSVGF